MAKKVMKRLTIKSLFLLVFVVIVSGFVSANACSNPSQEILALSSDTNAHAELASLNNYNSGVCYHAVFGENYDFANPTDCQWDSANQQRPTNLVLRVSDNTNAHLEVPTGDGGSASYQNVCYGDLVCQPRVNGCRGQEVELLSLSSNTNAHAELASLNNYDVSICCTSLTVGTSSEVCDDNIDNDGDGDVDQADSDCSNPANCELGEAYWADTNGVRYDSGTSVPEYGPVQLVVEEAEGSQCNGIELSYEIREDDNAVGVGNFGSADPLPPEIGNAGFATFDSSGEAVLSWNTVWTDDTDSGLGDDDPEYIFRATMVLNSNKNSDSENEIKVTPSDHPEPPKANITAPVHRGIYFLGTTETFDNNPGVGVNPDNLEYLWRIEHDDGELETHTEKSFEYTFAEAGQETITLRVRDPATDLSSEDQVAVVVLASPGILAFVDQPSHLELWEEILVNDRPRLVVDYSAQESFVIDSESSSGSCPVVECLAGVCPATTQNVPDGCTQSMISVSGTPAGWANTKFEWEFGDGNSNSATGVAGVTQRKLFGSQSAGTVTTDLVFNYSGSGAGNDVEIEKQTSRTFELGKCVDNGNSWRVEDSDGGVWYTVSTQTEEGVCRGGDGLTGTLDDCCAAGLVCGDPGDGNGIRCFDDSSDDNINYCQDYVQESNCLNDTANVLENNPGYDQTPECGTYYNGAIVECSCAWTDIAGDGNMGCFFNKEYRDPQNPDDGGDDCTYNYSFGACESGYRSVEVMASWNGDASSLDFECEDQTLVVLCGSPSIDLSFFEMKQFIFAVLSVFIIYYFIIRSSEKREK